MADKSYFQKFVLSTKVLLPTGKSIPWVNVGWNTGALETEDDDLIKELDACAKAGIGGVRRIDKPAFDELKKNSTKYSPKQAWVPGTNSPHPVLKPSQKADSEKSSKPAAAAVKPVEKPEKPTVAKGVFADIDTIHKAE